MFNDEIELGNLIENVVKGEVIKTIEWVSVLANQLDDSRSEFYQAAVTGLKPELVFEINGFEFESEEYVRFNNIVYTIIRNAKRGEMRELTCSARVGSEG